MSAEGQHGTVPGEDHEGVKRSLVEHDREAAASDPWMKDHPPKVRFVGYDAQASEIPVDHPIVQTVCKNYTEVTGREPEISGRQGAADTRFLNLYGDTPTVIFGPGSTAVMHCRRRIRLDRRLPDRDQGHGAEHLRLVQYRQGLRSITRRTARSNAGRARAVFRSRARGIRRHDRRVGRVHIEEFLRARKAVHAGDELLGNFRPVVREITADQRNNVPTLSREQSCGHFLSKLRLFA